MKQWIACCIAVAMLNISMIAKCDPVSFTATPMLAEHDVKPGALQTGAIAVKHEANGPAQKADLHLRVYVVDWTLDAEGNPLFIKSGEQAEGCAAWASVSPSEIIVPAGGTRSVRYSINVPKESQGLHHMMLMFEAAPTPGELKQSQVAVNGRIGCAIYLQTGSAVKRVRIGGFSIDDKEACLTLSNTGTAQLRPKGELVYRDPQGKELARTSLPSGVVLPGSSSLRNFRMKTPLLPKGVEITVTATIDYGGEVLLGARSRVTLQAETVKL